MNKYETIGITGDTGDISHRLRILKAIQDFQSSKLSRGKAKGQSRRAKALKFESRPFKGGINETVFGVVVQHCGFWFTGPLLGGYSFRAARLFLSK
jgi:hypothetical protein